LLAGALSAQSIQATITGTVTDPSGAAVPKVEVSLKNLGQESVRKAVTNESGFYSIPNLAPGQYELTAMASGFKQVSRKGISVLLNQQITLDFQLEIGATTETVNVTEMVAQINTTDAVRQEGVSGRELNELPIVVSGGPRSAATFTVLLPGVSTGGSNDAFDARINGGLQTGQEAIMDGVSMQQGSMSQSGMISFFDFRMTPDMVSEFKVLTSNYEPQYGASTSAQMIVETKSGADQFHGGGFEYLRNEKLNARSWAAASRPVDKQHNYGGFLGGPVKIPVAGIFKGKARTYFYTDIESFRAAGGNNVPTLSLPTVKMKNGDFSEWRTADGTMIPIYDPTSTRTNPNFNPGLAEGPNNLRYLRDQFSGNVIPGSRFANSLSRNWLKYSPDPNLPGTLNNYRAPKAVPDSILADTNYFMGRVDHYWGESDHVYGTLWHQRAARKDNSVLPVEIATENFSDPQNSWVNRLNWSHIFTPTLINHWNIGYLNRNEGYGAITSQYNDLFPAIKGVADPNTPAAMSFGNGYNSYSSSAGPNTGNITTRPTWITTNLTTWIKGNHTFKFGGEYRYLGQDFNSNTNTAGSFYFDPLTTGLTGLPNSGHAIASFLLDSVSSANADFRTVNFHQMRQHGIVFHAGDTWRVKKNVSINYGIRWDVFTPTYEKNNQLSFFDPDGVNPSAGGLKGRLAFAGDDYGAASYGEKYSEKVWYGGWAPRLGIAWTVTPKTVIRTGYGIFITQNYYPGWGGGGNLDGFNTNASFGSTLNGLEPAMILGNGFPQNFQKPPFIDAGFRNGRGTLYRPVDANRRPYTQQWNLTVERELPSNVLLSLGYVGNKGTRLPTAMLPINALNPSLLSMGGKLGTTFQEGQLVAEGVRAPYAGWVSQLNAAGCNPTVAQALLPFPQYCDQFTGQNEIAGNSTYHSLQTKVEKRFSSGMYLLASYTWGKILTDAHSTNPGASTWNGATGVISPFERKRNKGLAADDVAHVFSAAFVYDLPFGKGRRFGSGASGFANGIIGGWSINVIQKISSGTPWQFRNGDNCTVPGQFRLGCIPGVLSGKDAIIQDMGDIDVNKPVFDKSAFEQVGTVGGQYYYGVGSRITSLRGPGFKNTDFSVVKNIPFNVSDFPMNVQLRGEFFNLWNAHYFSSSCNANSPCGRFSSNVGSPNFGMWDGSTTGPRNIQLTLRVTF
jgi:hypothetical protein